MYILLVDDDTLFLHSLRDHLTVLGHHAILAQDGIRALREYEHSGPFDAVITDMQMPYMSGLELLQAIWADSNSIPALLHSSEPTGYMRDGQGRRKVDLRETVSHFDFARFHLKDGSFGYVDAFLDTL